MLTWQDLIEMSNQLATLKESFGGDRQWVALTPYGTYRATQICTELMETRKVILSLAKDLAWDALLRERGVR